MNEQIDGLEKNITHISQELKSLTDLIGTGFTKVDTNFNSIKKEINMLNSKVEVLTQKVDMLKGSTNDGFDTVGFQLVDLKEEISKISVVTNYEEQFNDLKNFPRSN
jgi:archaellum component FlaC